MHKNKKQEISTNRLNCRKLIWSMYYSSSISMFLKSLLGYPRLRLGATCHPTSQCLLEPPIWSMFSSSTLDNPMIFLKTNFLSFTISNIVVGIQTLINKFVGKIVALPTVLESHPLAPNKYISRQNVHNDLPKRLKFHLARMITKNNMKTIVDRDKGMQDI